MKLGLSESLTSGQNHWCVWRKKLIKSQKELKRVEHKLETVEALLAEKHKENLKLREISNAQSRRMDDHSPSTAEDLISREAGSGRHENSGTDIEADVEKRKEKDQQSLKENRAESSRKRTETGDNSTNETEALGGRHKHKKIIYKEADKKNAMAMKKKNLARCLQKTLARGAESTVLQGTDSDCSSKSDKNASVDQNGFPCRTCGYKFTQEKNLKRHIQALHEQQKPHKCSFCNGAFYQSSDLKVHMMRHAGEKPHKCSKCSMRFTTRCSLVNHVTRIHTDNSDRNYKCDLCGNQYRRQSDLSAHKRKMHPDAPQVCTMETTSLDLSSKTNKITPADGNRFRCSTCGDTFTQNIYLQRHIQNEHEKQKPYKCSICNRSFSRSEHLKHHMMRHAGQKPHKCANCEMSFTTKSQLVDHARRLHTDKPRRSKKCDMRGDQFRCQKELSTHKRLHPDGTHVCIFCERVFTLRRSLWYHLRRHIEEL